MRSSHFALLALLFCFPSSMAASVSLRDSGRPWNPLVFNTNSIGYDSPRSKVLVTQDCWALTYQMRLVPGSQLGYSYSSRTLIPPPMNPTCTSRFLSYNLIPAPQPEPDSVLDPSSAVGIVNPLVSTIATEVKRQCGFEFLTYFTCDEWHFCLKIIQECSLAIY